MNTQMAYNCAIVRHLYIKKLKYCLSFAVFY